MNTEESYQQKVKIELEQVKAQLSEYKSRKEYMIVRESIFYDKKIKELEKKVTTYMAILKEKDNGNAVFFEQALHSIKNSWASLQTRYKRP